MQSHTTQPPTFKKYHYTITYHVTNINLQVFSIFYLILNITQHHQSNHPLNHISSSYLVHPINLKLYLYVFHCIPTFQHFCHFHLCHIAITNTSFIPLINISINTTFKPLQTILYHSFLHLCQ